MLVLIVVIDIVKSMLFCQESESFIVQDHIVITVL